jgi:hypothetical protein
VAGPLLLALRLPAAFFVNPALVGKEGRATWDEIRSLATQGFAIGSHGFDHTLLDGLGRAELERQVAGSKQEIEERLGRPVEALSLPGGTGGERARTLARAAGFRLVLGSRPGALRGKAEDAVLPRITLRRRHGLEGFRAAVERRPLFVLRQQARYALTLAGRRLLGTGGYARLRARRLARDAGGAEWWRRVLLAAAVVVYTWVGYPALIALLARLRPAPPCARRGSRPGQRRHRGPQRGGLHRDEARRLPRPRPADRLEVVVASDGSDDRTDALVCRFARAGCGWCACRGAARPRLSTPGGAGQGEILVLTDARRSWSRRLRALVENSPTRGWGRRAASSTCGSATTPTGARDSGSTGATRRRSAAPRAASTRRSG